MAEDVRSGYPGIPATLCAHTLQRQPKSQPAFAGADQEVFEIPFWLYSDKPKWVSGIRESTTCRDVLMSLVQSDTRKIFSPEDVREKRLVLVEQWRGVEKPLSNSSRILKMWKAWGQETHHVKFVVKKISGASLAMANRRPARRRRSSVSSLGSGYADELHPKGMRQNSDQFDEHIHEMMKIIVAQSQQICQQLERCSEQSSKKGSSKRDEVKEQIQQMSQLIQINDEIHQAELDVDRLHTQILNLSQQSQTEEVSRIRLQVNELRMVNEQASLEIAQNQKGLHDLDEAMKNKRTSLKHLEYDVNVIEKEGRKLAKELQKVMDIRIEIPTEPECDAELSVLDSHHTEKTVFSDSKGLKSLEGRTSMSSSPESSSSHCSIQSSRKSQELSPLMLIKNTSLGKPRDAHSGDGDTNSDTGLSSLHSSSDEGTYEMGTLV